MVSHLPTCLPFSREAFFDQHKRDCHAQGVHVSLIAIKDHLRLPLWCHFIPLFPLPRLQTVSFHYLSDFTLRLVTPLLTCSCPTGRSAGILHHGCRTHSDTPCCKVPYASQNFTIRIPICIFLSELPCIPGGCIPWSFDGAYRRRVSISIPGVPYFYLPYSHSLPYTIRSQHQLHSITAEWWDGTMGDFAQLPSINFWCNEI